MSKKERYKELVMHLPKDLNYSVHSDGSNIYTGILISISFAIFIKEDSIGVKSLIGNLEEDMIAAISTIIKYKRIGEFKHRTYGSNKTQWSIWELSIDGLPEVKVPEILNKLKATIL
tara:strand:- start:34561 stop:34911 length:351 start_codon:yes stop_codon:yes gene_type:complete